MRSPSNSIRVLGILSLVFAFAVPLFPQTTLGRILGSVSDQSGAAVAGAKIVITDVQRGTNRTVSTDGSGNYVAPELQPGVYKVRAEAIGFKTVERENIEVEVAQALREGTPSIELNPNSGQPANQGIPSNANTLVVGVWMLQPGEDAIVGRRIREVLTSRS